MILLLALLIADIGSGERRERCDMIELNHKLDEYGNHCFTQVIIWNWKPEVCRHHVDAWWMVDRSKLHTLPTRTANGWIIYRFDGNGKRSSMSAKIYRETTTVNDPEADDKKHWHETRRGRVPTFEERWKN